jgi:aryl-alcohol dehydrogenase-like predicted oxidoreductase
METVERINGIPTRILGRTGIRVTVLCVGGYHMAKTRNT